MAQKPGLEIRLLQPVPRCVLNTARPSDLPRFPMLARSSCCPSKYSSKSQRFSTSLCKAWGLPGFFFSHENGGNSRPCQVGNGCCLQFPCGCVSKKGDPFFGGNRLVNNMVLTVLFLLLAVSGCDVLSCSCEQMAPSFGKACTHRNTHASAHRLMHGQSWLQMLAKNVWRATCPSQQT